MVYSHPLRLDLCLSVVEAEAVSRLKVGVHASSFPGKRACGQLSHLRRLHRSRLVALRVWNLSPADCRVYSDDVSVAESRDHRRSRGRGLSVFWEIDVLWSEANRPDMRATASSTKGAVSTAGSIRLGRLNVLAAVRKAGESGW